MFRIKLTSGDTTRRNRSGNSAGCKINENHVYARLTFFVEKNCSIFQMFLFTQCRARGKQTARCHFARRPTVLNRFKQECNDLSVPSGGWYFHYVKLKWKTGKELKVFITFRLCHRWNITLPFRVVAIPVPSEVRLIFLKIRDKGEEGQNKGGIARTFRQFCQSLSIWDTRVNKTRCFREN